MIISYFWWEKRKRKKESTVFSFLWRETEEGHGRQADGNQRFLTSGFVKLRQRAIIEGNHAKKVIDWEL